MGNLILHAERELKLLGEDDETINGYIRVVRAFSLAGHSGMSAMAAIPVIMKLLQYQNLTPLTDDPAEWLYHDGGKMGVSPIWQNRRNGTAMSNDGGKTYWLVTDKKRRIFGRKKYKSKEVPHVITIQATS